jgi:hypothetical protein
MNHYNNVATNLPNNGTAARPRWEFEEWVDNAFTNSSVLSSAGIESLRNSSGTTGAAAGSGSFPDFILDHRGVKIYLECKSIKGNPSEIQNNSTIPSGKYLTSDGTIVDVHYLYCKYDNHTGEILKLAVIDAYYYGEDPNLLETIKDFVYTAIEQHINNIGSFWQVERGGRGAIYINDISPFSDQRLRCRIRQMYHSGNPFVSHDSLPFFCITLKSKWTDFQNRTILGNISFQETDYTLRLHAQNADVDFVILQI